MERIFVTAASVLALVGVGMGAFGAHALRTQLEAQALATFEVGVRYQMYHALALFAVAWYERPGGFSLQARSFSPGVFICSSCSVSARSARSRRSVASRCLQAGPASPWAHGDARSIPSVVNRKFVVIRHSRASGNPDRDFAWTPRFAGMTSL